MSHINKAVIIGLGLIGGSLAKALRKSDESLEIIACDANIDTVNKACFEGVANLAFLTNDISDYTNPDTGFIDHLKTADIIFLCTNVDLCMDIARSIIPHINKETIITDVCSTKRDLEEFFNSYDNVSFIGGHPMTGSEKSGYDASFSFLFENSLYILCPNKNSTDKQLETLKEVVKRIGGIPYVYKAKEHDEVMARISHFPHVLATALVHTACKDAEKIDALRAFAAGGFRDMTRIAASSPSLWKSITMNNASNVSKVITDCISILENIRDIIDEGNEAGVEEFFKIGRENHKTFDVSNRSFMNFLFELSVNVEDKPGAIAEITTKLRNENINIKNIYIAESRELEGGCLKLAFDTKELRDRAKDVLKDYLMNNGNGNN